MNSPRFSVIIPTLNEEKFLPNLLESLVSQTQKFFEVIVVDGASKDNTVTIACAFNKKLSIRVIECDHARLPMQRNRGARLGRGAWLVFIDADSVLLPYCLARLDEFVRKRDAAFVTPWGKPDSDLTQDALSALLYNMFLEGGLLFKRPISPGMFTAVVRSAFDAIGGYDESLQFAEDQNLSQRLSDHGVPLTILRETLYVWSMRRFRAQGILKPMQAYIRSWLMVLFTKQTFHYTPEYVMGGHVYAKKQRPIKGSRLRDYEKKLKKIMREVFG